MAVYFLHSPELQRVKIGYSSNPRSRISNLMTASPASLDVLAVINGSHDDEKFLHHVFADDRANREWFEYDRSCEHPSYLPLPRPADIGLPAFIAMERYFTALMAVSGKDYQSIPSLGVSVLRLLHGQKLHTQSRRDRLLFEYARELVLEDKDNHAGDFLCGNSRELLYWDLKTNGNGTLSAHPFGQYARAMIVYGGELDKAEAERVHAALLAKSGDAN
jgi:hypothetical protein